jgi:Lysyl oxidase
MRVAAGAGFPKRLTLLGAATLVAAGLALASVVLTSSPRATASSFEHLYPDLQTVVPLHLNLVNAQQREYLRFSNGIANTGPGPWALRAEHDLLSPTQTTTAIQEIRTTNDYYECGTQPKQVTACYEIAAEEAVSLFEYHPTHKHWHTADVALFEVRQGSPTGPVVGENSIKVGFCLVEVYTLEGNARTKERTFWDCHGKHQGIGSGWVDQYHHATDGQEVELTGVPEGDDYYLVSTTDPGNAFLETDDGNNTAWVSFSLTSSSNGNRKVTVTGSSDCDTPALCGVGAPNR